jgi:hypothetical protein
MMLALAVSLSLAAAPDVAGRWEGDGFTLVLASNGSGTISDAPGVPPEPLTWKAAKGTLHLTQDGDTIPYAMKLAGGAMTLSSEVLERPVTLRRVGDAKTPRAAPAVVNAPPPKAPARARLQPPSCEGACQHYTSCAQQGADTQQVCVAQCYSTGVTAPQLAAYVQLDCQRAIAVMMAAQLEAQQAAQGGSGSGGQAQDSRCKGCVRSGSDCVWISQSDWGRGPNSPYSGAVTTCDADCCGL